MARLSAEMGVADRDAEIKNHFGIFVFQTLHKKRVIVQSARKLPPAIVHYYKKVKSSFFFKNFC